jgi:hypothetical protein
MIVSGLLQVHSSQVGPVDPGAPPLPGGAAAVVRFFMEVPQPIQIGGLVVGGIAAATLLVFSWRHRVTVFQWIRALPAPVLVMAAAILLVGGAAASVAGYRVYDFVEHDNRFCTGCHVMADAFMRFEDSPHNELGCKECHAQPRTESARQLYLWVMERPMEVGAHAPVPDARCTSCHVDQDEGQWPQIAASLGHRVHFDSDDPELGGLMCVVCHGVSVHEFTPVEATCGECHVDESHASLGRMGAETELHCVVCHDFLAREPAVLPGVPEGMAMLPDRSMCVACHEMAALLEEEELDRDPHGAVCGACHNPHVQITAGEAVDTCMGCHEDAETLTIFHTGTHAPVLPRCTECHSAHSWSVEGSDCVACHDVIPDPAPPPAGPPASRPGRPSASVPPEAEAEAEAEAGARAGEGIPLHAWALLAFHPSGGGDGTVGPGGVGGTGGGSARGAGFPAGSTATSASQPRPFRHRQHETISCVECHGRADEHGVVTVRTARDCAQCHHDPARGYACQDCHGEADIPTARDVEASLQLTVWEESRTRVLPFEHGTHDGISCEECHTGPVLLAAEVGCAECHADHHRAEADCAACHAPAEEGVHGLTVHLTCTSSGCHAGTAGARPPLARTLCLVCHTDQRDHEPGLDCHACHMVPESPPVRTGAGNGRSGAGAVTP